MDAKSLLLATALRHRISEPNIEAGFERFRTLISGGARLPNLLQCRRRVPARGPDT